MKPLSWLTVVVLTLAVSAGGAFAAAPRTGRVVDTTSAPVPDARVLCCPLDDTGILAELRTGPDGAFPLVASANALVYYAVKDGLAWGRSPAPESPASPVTIVLLPPGAVTGRVTDRSGKPIPGATVYPLDLQCAIENCPTPVTADLPLSFIRATTGPDGRFTLDALPRGGNCSLRVEAPVGFANIRVPLGRASRNAPIPVPFEGLTITLDPARRIQGRLIHAATGRPAVGVTVWAHLCRSIIQMEGAPASILLLDSSRTDDKGVFSFDHLLEGAYELAAGVGDGWDGVALPHPLVELRGRQAVEGIELRWTEGVPLTVETVDATTRAPVSYARVLYSSQVDSRDPSQPWPACKVIRTDAKGRVSLRVLRGKGGFTVSHPAYDLLCAQATVSDDVDATGSILHMTPAAVTRARIVDAAGRPLPGSVVLIERRYGTVFTADAEGRVSLRLDPWAHGVAHAYATSRDGLWAGVFKLPSVGSPEATWSLRKAACIAGRVERSGGLPIAGVRIETSATNMGGDTDPAVATSYAVLPLDVAPDGQFRIGGLLPDHDYSLILSAPGFRTARVQCRAVGQGATEMPPVFLVPRDDLCLLVAPPVRKPSEPTPPSRALPDVRPSTDAASASPAAAPAQFRLAILPGDGSRAPLAALLDACEVCLTGEPSVLLVERAQIRRILAEQKLGAAGLVDPKTVARMGQLLSADAFLFVDRIPGANPNNHSLRVIETQTGATLSIEVFTLDDFTGKEAPAAQWVALLLARRRVAPDQRRYVAVMPFKNEEPDPALDDTAQALTFLLARDLSRSPEIIVLDRDYVDRLRDESTLTGVLLALRASSTLIVGGLRRSSLPNTVALASLHLTSLGGGPPQVLEVPLSSKDIAVIRREVASAVTQTLRTAPPPPFRTSPVVEAARLTILSGAMAHAAAFDDALRAAQAAYALDPCDATRLSLARSWLDLGRSATPQSPYVDPPEAQRILLFKARIRAQRLFAEQADIEMRRIEQGHDARFSHFASARDFVPPFPALASAQTGPVLALQKEALDIDHDLLCKARDFCRKRLPQFEDLYWDLLLASLSCTGVGSVYDQDPSIRIPALQQYIDSWVDACAELAALPNTEVTPNYPGHENTITLAQQRAGQRIHAILSLANRNGVSYAQPPKDPAARARYIDFFRKNASHPDPYVRLMACSVLIRLGDDSAAEPIIALFPDRIAFDSPAFRAPQSDPTTEELLSKALVASVAKKPDLAADWCEKNLSPFIALPASSRKAYPVRKLLFTWLTVLETAGQYQKATAVGDRILAAVASMKPPPQPSYLFPSPESIAQSRSRYPGGAAAAKPGQSEPDPASSPWNRYTLTPVSLGARPSDTFQCIRVIGDSAYSVFSDSGTRDFRLAKFPLPKPAAPFYQIHFKLPLLPGQPDRGLSTYQVTEIVRAAGRLYIGTRAGIVEVDETAKTTRLYGEADGCPSVEIRRLTAHEGKLYFSAGDERTALYSYDPHTGKADLLASSVVAVSRNPLDGKRLDIRNLVSDPERRCIWIGDGTYGLWRYRPQDALFEHITSAANVRLLPQGLLCGGQSNGVTLLDPVTLKDEPLIIVFGGRVRKDLFPANYHSARGVQLWPAACDADTLFLGVFGAFAIDRRTPNWVWRGALPGAEGESISSFEPSPFGLLAVSSKGSAWLIQRRSDAAPAPK